MALLNHEEKIMSLDNANETKKCKHCQIDIPKKAKVCPNCRKKQKRPVLGIILIIMGVLILIGVFAGGEEDGPEKVASNSSVESSSPEVPEFFEVGDTAEYRDVKVTLDSIVESNGSQFNTPSDGNIFLIATFTIENNTDSDLAVSSMISFDAYQDGYSTNLSLSALIEKDGEQLDGTIAPGKKMKGSVGYEVPADYSEFEISYQSDLWSSKKFTFVYKK